MGHPILDFLRSAPHNDHFPIDDNRIGINKQHLEDLNRRLRENPIQWFKRPVGNPRPGKGQVWTTTCSDDCFTYFTYDVLIVSEPEDLYGEEVIRIQPVSVITDFSTESDVVINPSGLPPMLVETWNEQPMLVSSLETYLFDVTNEELEDGIVTERSTYFHELISDFRYLEIQNTFYLRTPVFGVLFENEHENLFIGGEKICI